MNVQMPIYVKDKYPQLLELYNSIYIDGEKEYWRKLSIEIEDYCKTKNIRYKNFFYHEKLVKNKENNV